LAIDPIETDLEPGAFGVLTETFPPNRLGHGIYNLEVEVSGYAGGSLITSNKIRHKVLRYDSEASNFLLGVMMESEVEQHTDIPITFLLAGTGADSYPMQMILNIKNKDEEEFKKELGSIYLVPNILNKQILIPLESLEEEYYLECKIEKLNITKTQKIIITEYIGELPVIDGTNSNLILYLNPKGRSNSLTTKNEWESSNVNYYNPPKAFLNNFFFGNVNGWFLDDNNIQCLKLNQKAKMTIPNFRPFEADVMERNRGMTIELDFKI
jgi:hypothetical protein